MTIIKPILFAAAVLASVPAYADVTGTVEATPAKFLKDTIVYVKSVPNTKLTPKTQEIDQKGMEFIPHISLLAVGDSVQFHNNDKVDHNVMSPDGGYDLGTWGSGQTKDQAFKKEGVFSQTCKLHPEMLAYVFVGQNRFAATVGADGKYTIAGLPPGTYELDVWNPKLKAPAQKITVGADGKASANFALTR
jgi:plastocyanin